MLTCDLAKKVEIYVEKGKCVNKILIANHKRNLFKVVIDKTVLTTNCIKEAVKFFNGAESE